TDIIMPALELAQETGKVVHWLKRAGDTVRKGEPIVEIETDKVTVEIEAPASGVMRDVTAQEGDVVPVGRTIAIVVGTDEAGSAEGAPPRGRARARSRRGSRHRPRRRRPGGGRAGRARCPGVRRDAERAARRRSWRRYGLANHGRAHDDQLDDGAPFLSGARG